MRAKLHTESSFPNAHFVIDIGVPEVTTQIGTYVSLGRGGNTRVYEVAINGVRCTLRDETLKHLEKQALIITPEIQYLILVTETEHIANIGQNIMPGLPQVMHFIDTKRGVVLH